MCQEMSVQRPMTTHYTVVSALNYLVTRLVQGGFTALNKGVPVLKRNTFPGSLAQWCACRMCSFQLV